MKRTAFLLVALLTFPWSARAQDKVTYAIDPEKSRIEIHVGKEGFFKAFGHDHLIAAKEFSGQAQFDPQKIEGSTVAFEVTAKSLTVVDPGESEKDRQEVQKTMLGNQVL